MNAYEGLFNMIIGLVLVGSLTAGTMYALMFATGVDTPWPARLLRTMWRVAVWLLSGFVLTVLFLGSLFSNLAAVETASMRLSLIFIPLSLWAVGSLTLISIGKARRVVPYLFAATGLGFVSAVNQIVLSMIATDIGAPPQLAGFPIFMAYCAAVGIVLHGLTQPTKDQVVRWLVIGASISLISGSLMIGPAVLLSEPDGDGYGALVASLVWSATALSVWSVGTAAFLTAGRTGAVVPFIVGSIAVYVAVLLILIGAAGTPGPVLGALTFVALNCAAFGLAWRFLSVKPKHTSVTASLSPTS